MTCVENISNNVTNETNKKKDEIEKLENKTAFVNGYYQIDNRSNERKERTDNGIWKEKDGAETKVANILLKSVVIYIDELGLFEPKLDITYENLLYEKTIKLENIGKSEIEPPIASDIAFMSDKSIIPFFESVFHSDWKNMEYKKGVFIEGFFYHNGKVINNTINNDLEFTMEDVRDAINLINTIISDRGNAKANDATVMRFMLWSPFAYCLKEIGFSDAIYSLILYGKPQASKTGSINNFSWFYSEPDNTDKVISTLSVFGSRLQETTLPTLIDEAKTFLSNKEHHDPIKRAILSKKTRGVKSSSNNNKIDEYDALSLPIFTYNEYMPIADYFGRRFKVCHYDKSMIISDKKKKEFNIKYLPKATNKSKFKIFRCIGKMFQDKMIPYIERSDEHLMDIEQLTVDILKEIASEVGVEFDKCIYEIQESNTDTFIDLKSEIREKLNQLFRKNHYKGIQSQYSKHDFVACANNGEIPFLYINANDEFVIHSKKFVETVSKLVDESLTLDELMEHLDMEIPTTTTLTVNGKSMKGFKIDEIDLEWKMFGIRVNERNDDEYDEVGWWCDI